MDVSVLSLSAAALRMAQSPRHPHVDLVEGEAEIIGRIREMADRCTTVTQSFASVHPGGRHVCLNDRVRKGVVFQSVWANDEATAERSSPVRGAIAVRRFGEVPFTKMIINDRSWVLVSIPGVSTWDAAVSLRGSARARPYANLFDTTFRNAAPPVRIAARLAELLAHLRAGDSDGQIARRMGVTDRTIRRWLHALHELSGTSTRFQLGEWAAAHMVTVR